MPGTVISIRERGITCPDPVVSIDGQEYPFALKDPFSPEEEQQLEWYFERYLNFPFTHQVKAQEAAASVRTYGERLFDAVFADRDAYSVYRDATQGSLSDLTIEIAGTPSFQRYHWEALRDPKLKGHPLALQVSFVRRNLTSQPIKARLRESPTVNVLLVTARPGGARDVGYRTIARPLLDTLRQAKLRVKVHILRPGTYEALSRHLEEVQEQHGSGYYHVIHFDVHGGLLSYKAFDMLEQQRAAELLNQHTFQMQRYGRPAMSEYKGVKAFLFLEHPAAETPDPVEAAELANLLQVHGIPIAILNACQSAKQLGVEQETSLGSQLMAAGVQMVLAMGYSVTVSAARLLMREFYDQLFRGVSLGAALRSARKLLHDDKRRGAYYNQQIELEDWLLPVVYENRPQTLRPREFTPEESAAHFSSVDTSYPEPQTTYRFVGRDLDILEIERRLLNRRNILLLRGMGGAGKTTLLRHLAWWWQRTGFVDQVFYYGYDQRAWTRQQIMDDLGRRLLGEIDYLRYFQPLQPEAQQALLAEKLRATRHLLILDNLESITGAELAIQHTLPPAEQQSLHRFVQLLAGGQTLVLLGSRGGEEWLLPHTFDDNIYVLPGLDQEAASELADLILVRHNAEKYRSDENLAKLLKLLDGYPLALEVVLANLARQTPGEVLATLVSGAPGIDGGEPAESSPALDFSAPDIQKKTESIVACIAYSHSNLSAEAQQLLLCLAPFTSVIYQGVLDGYTAELKKEPGLANLHFELWRQLLEQAGAWGLVSPHSLPGFLHLQPTLPYFLRSRQQQQPELQAQVESAFYRLYDGYGGEMLSLLSSRDKESRTAGIVFVREEFENLVTALDYGLLRQQSCYNTYGALTNYIDKTQQHELGLWLGQRVQVSLQRLPLNTPSEANLEELARVTADIGSRQMELKHYAAAEHSYRESLSLIERLANLAPARRGDVKARICHQLGRVAAEQRQWEQAEQHYQQALAILIEFNDRYEQATTYHQLGNIAQEQRQWGQAEQYYQQALAIFIEFNDRYSQARTYHQLGMVAQKQREWGLAEQHYKQALTIKNEFNDRYSQAITYHQLGTLAVEQREWTQAEQHSQQALAIYIEFNDRYSQARLYHNLGMVAQEQREWTQAEQHYQQSLAIYIEFNERYSQADTYHNLGIVAQEQRQWAQAEQHYQQALAIFIEFNDRYEQADTYHQLGIVAQEQRQWEQAEQYYQQALTIKNEFNDRYSQARTYHQLGTLAQEQRQWTQARQYLLQALTIFLDFDDQHNMGITLLSLARLWRDAGDATLPAATAAIGHITPEKMESWFRQALAEDGVE